MREGRVKVRHFERLMGGRERWRIIAMIGGVGGCSFWDGGCEMLNTGLLDAAIRCLALAASQHLPGLDGEFS